VLITCDGECASSEFPTLGATTILADAPNTDVSLCDSENVCKRARLRRSSSSALRLAPYYAVVW
jgi:hypothetical protein